MSRPSGLKAYAQNSIAHEIMNKSKEEIFAEYEPRILSIARRMARKIPPSAPLGVEDLASYGAIGLLEAIERFDPSRNNQFGTFADYRIRGAMFDALRSFDNMSRHRREQARDVTDAEEVLQKKLGRMPSPGEIADELGISLSEFFHRKKHTMSITETSVAPSEEGEGKSIVEILADNSSIDPLEVVLNQELRERVQTVIESLPERQKQCILLYYGRNLNLSEVARVFDLTPSRISQILSRTRKFLHEALLDIAVEQGYDVED